MRPAHIVRSGGACGAVADAHAIIELKEIWHDRAVAAKRLAEEAASRAAARRARGEVELPALMPPAESGALRARGLEAASLLTGG